MTKSDIVEIKKQENRIITVKPRCFMFDRKFFHLIENKMKRTFDFDREIWKRLDEDAANCLRSSTKHLEAILRAYYFDESFEMDRNRLEMLGELAPKSKTKTPVIKIETGNKKSKAG